MDLRQDNVFAVSIDPAETIKFSISRIVEYQITSVLHASSNVINGLHMINRVHSEYNDIFFAVRDRVIQLVYGTDNV